MARDAVAEVRDRTDIVELRLQLRPAQEGRPQLQGALPLPPGKDAVLRRLPRLRQLPLLRLRQGRRRLHLLHGRRARRVPRRPPGTGQTRRRRARLRPQPPAGGRRPPAPPASSSTSWPPPSSPTSCANTAAGAAGRAMRSSNAASQPTMRALPLGFAPDGWDALLRYLAAAASIRPWPSRPVSSGPRHRRLLRPLPQPAHVPDPGPRTGRIVGFGGRPRRRRCPSTSTRRRRRSSTRAPSSTVSTWPRTRSAARDQVVIVEGYMDAIAAHQFGYANVVATMGTALTESQVGLVKRLSKRHRPRPRRRRRRPGRHDPLVGNAP